MGVIAMDTKQITYYYSSENSIGKQINAYMESAEKAVLGIDISKTNVTGTQWVELADKLKKKVSDLVDTDHADFKNIYGNGAKNMNQHDWLKILEKEPKLLRFPIVLDGKEIYELKSAADFKTHMSPDSAGLKKPYNKE